MLIANREHKSLVARSPSKTEPMLRQEDLLKLLRLALKLDCPASYAALAAELARQLRMQNTQAFVICTISPRLIWAQAI